MITQVRFQAKQALVSRASSLEFDRPRVIPFGPWNYHLTNLCYNNNNKKLRPNNNFIYIVYNFIIIKLLIHLTKLHTWTMKRDSW